MGVCLPASCACSVLEGHRRASDSLELELQMGVSHLWELNSGSPEEQSLLLTAEPSLQPYAFSPRQALIELPRPALNSSPVCLCFLCSWDGKPVPPVLALLSPSFLSLVTCNSFSSINVSHVGYLSLAWDPPQATPSSV